jgi:purine-binding chemotaxis protein CheW
MTSKNKSTDEPNGSAPLPPSGLAEEILGTEGAPYAPPQRRVSSILEFADSVERETAKPGNGRHAAEALETWVTFKLDREAFGLPVSHVQEILRVATITRVPHAPITVRGVTNMRGRVLPVVDLRVRLGLHEAETDDHSRILVVSSHGRLLGLLVDSVQQVVRLDRNHMQPPPPDIMTHRSEYILGVYHMQDELVILLDVDRVLVIQDSLQEEAVNA